MAYLYPSEVRRLLGHMAIAFEWRLLWGFLVHEGARESEAIELTWSDLNLERGAVKLDRNTTDDPRVWPLNPSVTAALRAFRDTYRPDWKPADRVFIGAEGGRIAGPGLADLLRSHLKMIGLDKERPELFETTDVRLRIRVHDLRATFVTVSLANGRGDREVTKRTGHKSHQMVSAYTRNAETFAELNLGELPPLDQALPEIAQLAWQLAERSKDASDVAENSLPNDTIPMREKQRPQRELNPCYQRERLVS